MTPSDINEIFETCNGNGIDKWILAQAEKVINNQSIEFQKTVVKKSPYDIRYIKNPDVSVQKTAIEKDPKSISVIKGPLPEVQTDVVSKNPKLIFSISNPCKNAIDIADKNSEMFSNYQLERFQEIKGNVENSLPERNSISDSVLNNYKETNDTLAFENSGPVLTCLNSGKSAEDVLLDFWDDMSR